MHHIQRFFRLSLFVCLMPVVTAMPAAAGLNVRSAILMNMNTDKVLYAQDADRRIAPASLAKIMTMYVVMDQVRAGKVALGDKVKINRNAARQRGSRMHLKAGEKVSLDSLLAGVAVSSGNDAAMAVAEHVGGSVSNFVRLMNAKAKKIGLKATTFRNPHGLPAKGQETTARDMLVLSASYLKAHPSAMRYHRMRSLKHGGVITVNKNPLLHSCPGADGLKTGWIRDSGYNLVSTVKRGKTRLVGVVLGSATSKVRADEMRDLVEAGFMAVRSGGKVKVDEVLGRKSSHATRREDAQSDSPTGFSGDTNNAS